MSKTAASVSSYLLSFCKSKLFTSSKPLFLLERKTLPLWNFAPPIKKSSKPSLLKSALTTAGPSNDNLSGINLSF